MPNPSEIGWSAGIIDGEGCIGVYSRGGKRADEFRLQVCVSNTKKDILIQLNELWGGKYYPLNRRTKTNEKLVWMWILYDRRAGEFLQAILGDLIGKVEQAKIALEFVSLFGRGSARRTLENKEKRIELAKQLKLSKQLLTFPSGVTYGINQ